VVLKPDIVSKNESVKLKCKVENMKGSAPTDEAPTQANVVIKKACLGDRLIRPEGRIDRTMEREKKPVISPAAKKTGQSTSSIAASTAAVIPIAKARISSINPNIKNTGLRSINGYLPL
jgi:hypothetical protein